jgi:hypothetical protein
MRGEGKSQILKIKSQRHISKTDILILPLSLLVTLMGQAVYERGGNGSFTLFRMTR